MNQFNKTMYLAVLPILAVGCVSKGPVPLTGTRVSSMTLLDSPQSVFVHPVKSSIAIRIGEEAGFVVTSKDGESFETGRDPQDWIYEAVTDSLTQAGYSIAASPQGVNELFVTIDDLEFDRSSTISEDGGIMIGQQDVRSSMRLVVRAIRGDGEELLVPVSDDSYYYGTSTFESEASRSLNETLEKVLGNGLFQVSMFFNPGGSFDTLSNRVNDVELEILSATTGKIELRDIQRNRFLSRDPLLAIEFRVTNHSDYPIPFTNFFRQAVDGQVETEMAALYLNPDGSRIVPEYLDYFVTDAGERLVGMHEYRDGQHPSSAFFKEDALMFATDGPTSMIQPGESITDAALMEAPEFFFSSITMNYEAYDASREPMQITVKIPHFYIENRDM